jgi:hypothetical protein
MHNPLTNLKKAAEHIRLSEHEKDISRVRIFERIDASRRAKQAMQPTSASYFFFMRRMVVGMAAILIIVFGSGTAYAAQGALPGEVLYPVKVYVNEQVEGALAVSDQAKISYHTQIAETRLVEAETLANEGRLDATTSAELEANVQSHVTEATAIAAKIESADPGDAVDTSVVLDSSIAAHTAILDRIGSRSKDASTKENAHLFALNVRIHASGGEGESKGAATMLKGTAPVSPEQTTMAYGASDTASSTPEPTSSRKTFAATNTSIKSSASNTGVSSTTDRKIALQLQKRAATRLEDARDTYGDLSDYLSASTTAKVEAELADLVTAMNAGKKDLDSGDYTRARGTFTEVLRRSVELGAFIEASKNYKQDFVRGRGGDTGRSSDQDDDSDSQSEGVHIDLHL